MPASTAQSAATAARRTKAIAMRIAGIEWAAIAERLDYADRGAACKDVSRALEQYVAEQQAGLDVLRQQELMRLDRLQAAVWSSAAAGDPKSVDVVLRIIDRRIRLLGLDAPTRVDATVTETTQEDIELAEWVREAQAKAAADMAKLKEQVNGSS